MVFALQRLQKMAALAPHECFLQSARRDATGTEACAGGAASGVQPGTVSAGSTEERREGAWRGGVNGAVQARDIMSKSNQLDGVLLCMDRMVGSAKPADYRQYFRKS